MHSVAELHQSDILGLSLGFKIFIVYNNCAVLLLRCF